MSWVWYNIAEIDLAFSERSNYVIYIVNAQGEFVKEIGSGSAEDPEVKFWDGTDEQDNIVPHGTYYVMVNLTDQAGNENNEIQVGAIEVYDFILDLKQGWNQISVPKAIDDESWQAMYENDNITAIYGWDASAQDWVVIEEGLEPGYGYFVYSKTDQLIGVNYAVNENTPSVIPSVLLKGGWNLIGYSCLSPSDISSVIPFDLLDKVSVIYWYNPASQDYELQYADGLPVEDMYPGRGYWLHIPITYSNEELYYLNICYSPPA
ncbi:hypothetical protein DRJ04_06655 [Candidatus Aerophobetes bacterium]|uniref:FlgD/Vpr Ig-like domain-containing protein n=1 Tax=Aerophobetes bacterium TaxID=2030807 RepID=A0A662DD00_UNCAE|nr:MAG: hypothetical protein DRJ04_06655 [Candidatus Aerophobetes bacterium]